MGRKRRRAQKQAKEGKVQSKESQQRLEITKRINLGHMPLFVQMAHKGLEKAVPTGTSAGNGQTAFVVSKDILSMCLSDPTLANSVESIEFVYGK